MAISTALGQSRTADTPAGPVEYRESGTGPPVPRDHGKRLAELLPQGRFDIVRDSRTFIPEDQPERLVAAIRSFLA